MPLTRAGIRCIQPDPSSHLAGYIPLQKLPILGNRALFEKLDSEALFFSFYYQPGSYQQSLAAKELRRQSWRYHKQHGAWFQVSVTNRFFRPSLCGAPTLLLHCSKAVVRSGVKCGRPMLYCRTLLPTCVCITVSHRLLLQKLV
jgi:hypothetical protein